MLPHMFLRLSRVREYTRVHAATDAATGVATDLFQSVSTNFVCCVLNEHFESEL